MAADTTQIGSASGNAVSATESQFNQDAPVANDDATGHGHRSDPMDFTAETATLSEDEVGVPANSSDYEKQESQTNDSSRAGLATAATATAAVAGVALANVCRSHGQIGARAAASPRKGKGSLSKMPQADQRRLSNRLERFDLGMRPPPSSSSRSGNDLAFQSKPMVDDNGMVDWAAITIKGTSTKLEKDYLRLTQVRPPHVSQSWAWSANVKNL